MQDESTAAPRTRPPDLLDRVTRPVVGLGVVVFLGVLTFNAATSLESGGTLPTLRGRGLFFVAITNSLARILGVRGTVAIGAIAVAAQLILIGRAFREPTTGGGSGRRPTVFEPRTDVINAFSAARRRRRIFDFVQLLSALGIGALSFAISTAPVVPPIESAGLIGSLALLVGTAIVGARVWRCPACGGSPGARNTRVCATCGVQLD